MTEPRKVCPISHEELRVRHCGGESMRSIAGSVGIGPSQVRKRLADAGIGIRPQGRPRKRQSGKGLGRETCREPG